MTSLARKGVIFLEAIKFSHSIFALPFAVAGAFLAAEGVVPIARLGKIVLACVLARTAAMAFNRFTDADIDAQNPRTANRAVPAGRLSRAFMAGAALVASVAFAATTLWINRLAFSLSPLVLIVVLGYSYTKRFTSLSHLVLGLALGLSPLGAWVAVRGDLAWTPVTLGLAVLLWTAGFDVVYACQDAGHDTQAGLFSLPRRLGVARALRVARGLHAATVVTLLVTGQLVNGGWIYHAGVGLVAILLVVEHALVRPDDLSRLPVAFLTLNGLVSLFFMVSVIAEVML